MPATCSVHGSFPGVLQLAGATAQAGKAIQQQQQHGLLHAGMMQLAAGAARGVAPPPPRQQQHGQPVAGTMPLAAGLARGVAPLRMYNTAK